MWRGEWWHLHCIPADAGGITDLFAQNEVVGFHLRFLVRNSNSSILSVSWRAMNPIISFYFELSHKLCNGDKDSKTSKAASSIPLKYFERKE